MNKKLLLAIIIGLLICVIGYLFLDKVLYNGIEPMPIKTDIFEGNFYIGEESNSQVVFIALGGGTWGDYWAQTMAQNGHVGLSLPYLGVGGTPLVVEEFPLEYFEAAIEWLKKGSGVQPKQIIVMGASRNAELALVLASTYNQDIDGVIVYAPSSVSWSNTVIPHSSDDIKSAWTLRGQPLPFVSMEKISANENGEFNTFEYWKNGIPADSTNHPGFIPVEQISGPIVLISGKDDQLWPSSQMANQIERRLKSRGFPSPVHNLQYENSGHLVSGNPDHQVDPGGSFYYVDKEKVSFQFGGTAEGDFKAKQAARDFILQYNWTPNAMINE